jgi:hypothetical protein
MVLGLMLGHMTGLLARVVTGIPPGLREGVVVGLKAGLMTGSLMRLDGRAPSGLDAALLGGLVVWPVMRFAAGIVVALLFLSVTLARLPGVLSVMSLAALSSSNQDSADEKHVVEKLIHSPKR